MQKNRNLCIKDFLRGCVHKRCNANSLNVNLYQDIQVTEGTAAVRIVYKKLNRQQLRLTRSLNLCGNLLHFQKPIPFTKNITIFLIHLCQTSMSIHSIIVKILNLYIILSCTHLSLLSSIYPLPAMHSLLVTLYVKEYLISINQRLSKWQTCHIQIQL